FEKQGIEVIPAATDFTLTQDSWNDLSHPSIELILVNLIPDSSSISLTTRVMKEYIGMWIYRMRGWI
ncbi:MAG: YdcF family protein, partial [Anaerolineaceae bacterium]|nr:YdcF family protein [Anaerolineaceae bacterium]